LQAVLFIAGLISSPVIFMNNHNIFCIDIVLIEIIKQTGKKLIKNGNFAV